MDDELIRQRIRYLFTRPTEAAVTRKEAIELTLIVVLADLFFRVVSTL